MATPAIESNGLLLVDKPAGMTSHDVVAVARRALGVRRVGHTGTLDPFATGLLVLLFGRGTRLISYVPGEPKVYEAVIRFGVETDTDDATGAPIRSAAIPGDEAIARAIPRLTGTILQTPPAYSAKQVAGTRAYAAARRGDPLSLEPVEVTVHAWTVEPREGDRVSARIVCGGGTYVRALARDLGRLCDSAAHLEALRRTDAGEFALRDAVTVADLDRGTARMRPLLDAVPDLPVQVLTVDELRRVTHGNAIPARVAGVRVALVDETGALAAVAASENGELRPRVVLRDA